MLALVVVKIVLAAICAYSALMLAHMPGQGGAADCRRTLRMVALGIIALAFGFVLYGGEL